jgi:hypothetical protein
VMSRERRTHVANEQQTDRRVKFDFEVTFSNGGGIQGQGFRLDIDGNDIDKGIDFLKGEIGDHFGFCNIANAVLALLGLPYCVTRLNSYDCSSLVTRYLTECGVDLPGELNEQPDSVSLNDLARAG